MSKAWLVRDRFDDNMWCFVIAATPGKAKTLARDADETGSLRERDWTDLRAIRASAFDDGITMARLVRHGRMWIDCPACGLMIHPPGRHEFGAAFFADDGSVYCSEACWRLGDIADESSARGPFTHSAYCLYADV